MPVSPRMNVVLTEELRKRMDRVCKETGMSISLLMRKALNGYLDFCEEKIKDGSTMDVNPDVKGRYWK